MSSPGSVAEGAAGYPPALKAPDTLLYEFTVEDPATWKSSWTASMPMRRTDAPMFDYACHEGNYGMTNMLTGGRVQEKAAEDTARRE